MISIDQIRSARALLGWTQGELAKLSGLSLRALNSIERGLVVPRIDNLRAIQGAFEKGGVEFGENDGVRRNAERLEVVKFEGRGFFDQHLVDIINEVRDSESGILLNLSSEKDYADLNPDILDRYFEHLHRHNITERCLVSRGDEYIIGKPSAYRWLKKEMFNHVFYAVYGDNVAFQIIGSPHRTIIIRNPSVADMFRRQFEANWAMAEIPWFAKSYKVNNPQEPWSTAKGAEARRLIEKAKP